MKSSRARILQQRKKLLIFDCHAVCYYVKYSLGHLDYDGEGTGIIYGFLSQLLHIGTRYKPTHYIFAWDSRTSIRKEIFPEYKKKRSERILSPEEWETERKIYKQFSLLRKSILPLIGFQNNFLAPGFEADDIIGRVCLDFPGNKKTIVSSDNDLWQLIDKNCVQYDFQNRTETTVQSFKDKWNISPEKWWLVKTLVGCSSDEVPGIKGVGPITAIKFMTGNLKPTLKIYKKIQETESKQIQERNEKLVKLPLRGIESFVVKKEELSWDNFEIICLEYGMDSFLEGKMKSKWEKLLKRKSKI